MGLLYFTVPDNVWQWMRAPGGQILGYTYPPNKASTSDIVGLPCTKSAVLITPMPT